ncbi:hypothetical protein KY333_02870 [Candidatus Woesearchaeota archaeon]|nr:hypothetical protein [Candidatus Woesearchaeota archaeon]MBW2994383.1 hypothetical protein [Candidatus Woesearchaeota archaeon]
MDGRLNVGVDCDEPLADCNTYLQAWHNREYKANVQRADVTTFSLWKIWNCSRDESNKRICEFYEAPDFDLITPTPGSVEGIEELAKENDLFVVTSRVDIAIAKTKPFIDANYPGNFKDIYFTSNCSMSGEKSATKAKVCKQKNIDVLVDDCLQYALECQEEEIPTILFDCPWNQETELPKDIIQLPSGIVRAVGWKEVVSLVKLFKEDRNTFMKIRTYQDLFA